MASPVIFVVDDDADVRTAVRRLLLALRHPVRLFGSAEQFLSDTDRGSSGCLILDVRLPGMTGPQLQQRLSDLSWELPIVFITAHEDPHSRDAALRNGAIAYLPKPFAGDELLTSVRRALAARNPA
jgi:FixJ family two-component response regulator